MPTSTSTNAVSSSLSTPKRIVQDQTIEPNLNSNFDVCDNYPTAADNLFDNQSPCLLDSELDCIESTIIKQDLNDPTFQTVNNPPIFDADDLLSSDSDINQLLNVPNQMNDDQDLFFKEKKRKRIS